ncbi:MAG: hypothetical protein AAB757_00475 [Patescibacteria group bacterium]|mgnify:CR=1 FL=1
MKKLLISVSAVIIFFPAISFGAIAFDNVLNDQPTSGTSPLTFSFANNGNMVIVGFTMLSKCVPSAAPTYGGQAMTLAVSNTSDSNENVYLYYLLNPPTGANNVNITWNGSCTAVAGSAYSLSGVKTSSQPDAIGTVSSASATNLANTWSSMSDNSWALEFGRNATGGTIGAGMDTTRRETYSSPTFGFFEPTTNPKTPAASLTLNTTNSSAGRMIAVGMTVTPATTTPSITGFGTPNRIAKFISSSVIGDSLFADDGTDTTLTGGNLFLQAGKALDVVVSGILNIGTSIANAINIGKSGITTTIHGLLNWTKMGTTSNCSSTTSPANCGSAPAGSVVMPAGNDTLTVNTTAVTANSQIFITEDFSLGSRLGIICNTREGRIYSISSRTTSSSFVITSNKAPVTNPACLSYLIVN